MHIVLDTNVVVTEGYGASRRFKLFLSVARMLGYSVYVPEVVVDEVVAKFARVLGSEAEDLGKKRRRLTELLSSELSDPLDGLDLAAESESFRSRLLKQLSDASVQLLSYPTTSHRDLVKRATTRIRPFNEKGSGYRDTLIWMTVLDLVPRADDLIVLVAKDRMFRGQGTELNARLVSEAKGEGDQSTDVALALDLKALIDDYIRPNLKNVAWDDPVKTLSNLANDVGSTLDTQIMNEYAHQELDPNRIGLTWEFESPKLQAVSEFCDPDQIDVSELNTGQYLVKVAANFTGEFDVFMLKANWYAHEDDARLYLIDWDWNDFGLLASISLPVRCEAYLLVDSGGNLLNGYESIDIIPALVHDANF